MAVLRSDRQNRLCRVGAVVSLAFGVALGGIVAPPVAAGGISAGHHYTFDYWCTQVQRFGKERCAARGEDDVREYERVRRAISRYELEFKDKCDRRDQLRRDLECGDFFAPRRY